MISLAFHGAAGTVTGSKYLLTVNDKRVLIDCGMFQGRRALRERNWSKMPFDPAGVSAIILTHSHLDHIGYTPRLVRQGFAGVVYSTRPTAELAKILLLDAAHIQEEDAAYRNKKGISRHKEALPLFTEEDAEQALTMFEPLDFGQWNEAASGIRFRYHIAGHILGAGSVEVEANDGHKKRTILFSGDVGRYGLPLVVNPAKPPQTDYLVCESTYGGRVHPPSDPFFEMAELLDRVIAEKRILLIPAFAVGRTQQVTYMVDYLIRSERIRSIDVHVDSPMAVKVTKIYDKYCEMHSIASDDDGADCRFYGKNVTLHRRRKSSKILNKLKGPAIILSASGMMSGGRIMHHLINRLPDPTTMVAVVGFMAEGTLGRRLDEGEKLVYIHKQPIEVKAEIVHLNGLSGHADSYELMHWLEPISKAPRKVFVTHGEESGSKALAEQMKKQRSWECVIPAMDQVFEL